MPRPPKAGLLYFSKDTDYYDDLKIIDLLNEYGPLGQTIYDIIICMIYREGYYLEATPEYLARVVIRKIGNRWIKDKQTVVQVIHYCADIGLFNNDLLRQNVITSVGLQRRYAEVAKRRRFQNGKYWLLEDKTDKSLLNVPQNGVSATETGVIATETGVIACNNATKKSKVNKSKLKESKESVSAVPSPPSSLSEIEGFILEKKLKIKLEKSKKFFDYYDIVGWMDKHGNPINWKQKLLEWDTRELLDKSDGNLSANPSYDLSEFDKMGYDIPEEV